MAVIKTNILGNNKIPGAESLAASTIPIPEELQKSFTAARRAAAESTNRLREVNRGIEIEHRRQTRMLEQIARSNAAQLGRTMHSLTGQFAKVQDEFVRMLSGFSEGVAKNSIKAASSRLTKLNILSERIIATERTITALPKDFRLLAGAKAGKVGVNWHPLAAELRSRGLDAYLGDIRLTQDRRRAYQDRLAQSSGTKAGLDALREYAFHTGALIDPTQPGLPFRAPQHTRFAGAGQQMVLPFGREALERAKDDQLLKFAKLQDLQQQYELAGKEPLEKAFWKRTSIAHAIEELKKELDHEAIKAGKSGKMKEAAHDFWGGAADLAEEEAKKEGQNVSKFMGRGFGLPHFGRALAAASTLRPTHIMGHLLNLMTGSGPYAGAGMFGGGRPPPGVPLVGAAMGGGIGGGLMRAGGGIGLVAGAAAGLGLAAWEATKPYQNYVEAIGRAGRATGLGTRAITSIFNIPGNRNTTVLPQLAELGYTNPAQLANAATSIGLNNRDLIQAMIVQAGVLHRQAFTGALSPEEWVAIMAKGVETGYSGKEAISLARDTLAGIITIGVSRGMSAPATIDAFSRMFGTMQAGTFRMPREELRQFFGPPGSEIPSLRFGFDQASAMSTLQQKWSNIPQNPQTFMLFMKDFAGITGSNVYSYENVTKYAKKRGLVLPRGPEFSAEINAMKSDPYFFWNMVIGGDPLNYGKALAGGLTSAFPNTPKGRALRTLYFTQYLDDKERRALFNAGVIPGIGFGTTGPGRVPPNIRAADERFLKTPVADLLGFSKVTGPMDSGFARNVLGGRPIMTDTELALSRRKTAEGETLLLAGSKIAFDTFGGALDWAGKKAVDLAGGMDKAARAAGNFADVMGNAILNYLNLIGISGIGPGTVGVGTWGIPTAKHPGTTTSGPGAGSMSGSPASTPISTSGYRKVETIPAKGAPPAALYPPPIHP
jgi:hypothetical protein